MCPETQPWRKGLPFVGDSHRLQKDWMEDRYKTVDDKRIPLEPNWADCTSAKTLEEQEDLDAVQQFSDLKAVQHEGGALH